MIDSVAEYRLLACTIDSNELILKLSDDLFTDSRKGLFHAMKQAYVTYGDISAEGIERFYKKDIPTELEAGRGAKPKALIDKLAELALKRKLNEARVYLTEYLSSGREIVLQDIRDHLDVKPVFEDVDTSPEAGVMEFVSELNSKLNGHYKFISTGVGFLDYILGGEWNRSGVTLIMAKPGGGKTALINNSMLQMAMQGHPTYFASLEMPRRKNIARMISNLAEVDASDIKNGKLSEAEKVRVQNAAETIQKLPIYINDMPGKTVDEICYDVERHYHAYGIKMFAVDYLQIIQRTGNEPAHEELGTITERLRDIARKLDIACVLLAQQNEKSDTDSVYGSKKVAFCADTMIELERADKENDPALINLNIIKNREGVVGRATCNFVGKYQRFY